MGAFHVLVFEHNSGTKLAILMGNKNSCCARSSPPTGRKDVPHFEEYLPKEQESVGNLQHISEREPEDWDADPSLHPKAGTIFMERSKVSLESEYFYVTA